MNNWLDKFQKYEFPNYGLVRLPEVKISPEERAKFNIPNALSNLEILKHLITAGWKARKPNFDQNKIAEYKERIKIELELVDDLSFTDYFLLVWRVINKAREMGAYIDYGRGSCVSSLIFFCLGVTNVDPVRHSLLFSRFISKVRAKKKVIDGVTYLQGDLAPDVDLNLGNVRDQIVDWLNEEYKGRVCKIKTLGTFSGKILIKDVYKYMENVSEEEAIRVGNMIDKNFGIVEDIEETPKHSKEFKQWSEEHKDTYEVALNLRNLIRQAGVHPSGYMLTFNELKETVPLSLDKEKQVIECFDMQTAANIAIKLDLLGLLTNEIIQEILLEIPEKIEDIDKKLDNDKFIYDKYQDGNLLPYGLYQINADCAYKALLKIKPKNISELSDLNALARPGALDYLDGYVEGNHPCPHPLFKDILGPTRNYCLYQEQMIQMAVAIGFTSEEGELIRRIVGKKKVEEVKEWKQKVYDKCKENNLSTEIGDLFWKILNDSAKYSFNKSHSLGVSYLGALTTYLKYKYPLQYYKACLNSVGNEVEELKMIVKELYHFGIKLLPPCINDSERKFRIVGNDILMPISSIKGISAKAIEKLNKFKIPNSNKLDIFNSSINAKIPSNIFVNLTLSGSLDKHLSKSRANTLLEYYCYKLLTEKEREICYNFISKYNNDVFQTIKALNEIEKDSKGKPIIKDSRRETLRKYINPIFKMWSRNGVSNKVMSFFFETKLLGFSYTTNLYDLYKSECDNLMTLRDAKSCLPKEKMRVAAEIKEVKSGIGKKSKKPNLKIEFADHTDSAQIWLTKNDYSDRIQECVELNGRLPVEGDLVIFNLSKNEDGFWCDQLSIQDIKIYEKLSQVEKGMEENKDSAAK